MIYKINAYLSFYFKSFVKKKIESTTVIKLIKSMQNPIDTEKSIQFKDFKYQLLRNKNTIKVTDFGAGSRIFKSNKRRICDITRHVAINKKYAKRLIKLVEYQQPKNILEIGTSVGLATSALAIGHPKAKIISLEGCPETARVARKGLQKNSLSAEIFIGNFTETLPKVIEEKQFDLIFFDGNHQKQATLTYFKQCLASINENSILIFDDIYWSKEMQEAWDEIKKHPRVTITIDTFQWGIVLFNTQENKENFYLRM